jgi:hypothetical protein
MVLHETGQDFKCFWTQRYLLVPTAQQTTVQVQCEFGKTIQAAGLFSTVGWLSTPGEAEAHVSPSAASLGARQLRPGRRLARVAHASRAQSQPGKMAAGRVLLITAR